MQYLLFDSTFIHTMKVCSGVSHFKRAAVALELSCDITDGGLTFYSSELFEVNVNLQEFTLSSIDHFDRKPLTRLLDDKLKV